jgi:ABC-2 type transport system ATP-binding protein
MLSAQGLVKRYGSRAALDGFDLEVKAGEINGLVGHNGAGKTTFVEIVTGLVRPDCGRVRIGGVDALRERRAARRMIGISPQEQALYVSATARDNLRLFGALAGLRRSALASAIDRVSEDLQLTAVLDQRIGLLSGGQRRRTQAATALIGDPQLLLLDEPTAGTDPETRGALLAAVRARAEAGAAVVYTTHYLPELADLGATLAVAQAGKVIARGSQDILINGLPGELRLRFDGQDPGGALTSGAVRGLALPAALARRARNVDGELRIASTNPPTDLACLLAAGVARSRSTCAGPTSMTCTGPLPWRSSMPREAIHRTAALIRQNTMLILREPGPLASRMILPLAFLLLLHPLISRHRAPAAASPRRSLPPWSHSRCSP